MTPEHANALQDLLEREGREHWPPACETGVYRRIMEWRAFRESDTHLLKLLCNWEQGDHRGREYIPDPLPERVADAFADLIFGAEPDFQAPTITETVDGNDRSKPGPDQELLDDLIDENDLPSDLQDAASRCVGEGEVWWRIYVDRDAYEHPVIEWHSRDQVVPLYRGKKLLAVAFISDLSTLAPEAPVVRVGDDSDPAGTAMWQQQPTGAVEDDEVWRYIEIQTGGLTRNLLYQGDRGKLGEPRALTAREETADLPDEWQHQLDVQTRSGHAVPLMLAGRVTNGRAGRLGRSQYAGVKGLLYELNKLQSVGSRNVDLTMQKRAVIRMDLAEPAPSADDDEAAPRGRGRVRLPDAFLSSADDMGEGAQMGVLEFSDTWADALLAWDDGLTDKILTRCRVAPQLVGRHTEGAHTGPALRARLLDSIMAADGKARSWDDALPKLLRAMQMVDALPEEQGGCGHQWAAPEEQPTVERHAVLPEDETEEVTRHVAAVAGEIEARRTAIEALHPDWDAERVDHELELIAQLPPPTIGRFGAAPGAGAPGAVVTPRPPINLGVTAGGGNGAGA